MSARETVAVVGAGLAAAHAVEALRASGYDGHLVLYGAEPHHPYERPPLSKGYLLGNDERDAAFPHPAAWYDERDVDLRLTTTVTALDLDRHEVLTGDHRQRFDRLLLCTGATPRRLAMADRSGAPVAYLRTLEDCERLRDALRPGTRLVIVGAGWIGLEVAAAARAADCAVTVVETLDLPLLRVLGPEVAQVFADLHRAHGVDLRLATGVGGIVRDGELADVHLTDGSTLLADLVLVAVGAAPGTALAEAAGLDVDDGVVVDARLRTSTPTCSPPGTWPAPSTRCSGGTCAWSTGTTRSGRAPSPAATSAALPTSTTGSPTSSPTSTTSAWSTSARWARRGTTRWCCAATYRAGCSPRSGCGRGGSWPGCT